MTATLAEREFDALVLDTKRTREDLYAGAVLDLRTSLLLRHRLLLISDDVIKAFTLYKSIERFKTLGDDSFETQAAREAEKIFAPMVFFLNQDQDILSSVKNDIVKMAKEAAQADIQTLAAAVQKLAQARNFYKDALVSLMQSRDGMKQSQSEINKAYH